ncbi:DUF2218 domain-containing protein [Elstera litoralis]|uniref:DUF2218 domain-containing protein n=1 Tax=Elstera litoralis TaxID=552518 RepID=UPI000696035D|nr:DUF2218 domain-containing protein [Elstera litoralis]
MLTSVAEFETAQAHRYLTQVCKHFAHKIPVELSEARGECRFVCGTAGLEADAARLRLRVTAPTEAELVETQSVIESHLLRFAFREGGEALTWTRC